MPVLRSAGPVRQWSTLQQGGSGDDGPAEVATNESAAARSKPRLHAPLSSPSIQAVPPTPPPPRTTTDRVSVPLSRSARSWTRRLGCVVMTGRLRPQTHVEVMGSKRFVRGVIQEHCNECAAWKGEPGHGARWNPAPLFRIDEPKWTSVRVRADHQSGASCS